MGQVPEISFSPDRQKFCWGLSAPAFPPCKDPPSLGPGQRDPGDYKESPKQDCVSQTQAMDGEQPRFPGPGKNKDYSEVLPTTTDNKTQMWLNGATAQEKNKAPKLGEPTCEGMWTPEDTHCFWRTLSSVAHARRVTCEGQAVGLWWAPGV